MLGAVQEGQGKRSATLSDEYTSSAHHRTHARTLTKSDHDWNSLLRKSCAPLWSSGGEASESKGQRQAIRKTISITV